MRRRIINLGTVFDRLGKYQEAIAQFTEALRINPNFAEAHNNLGNVFDRLGKYQEAIAQYTEALRINPNFAEAHNNLGNVFDRLGKYQEAIAQYTEALRINPNFAEAHYNLGNVFDRLGKYQEAVAQYTEALRINPNFAEAHYNLGNVFDRLGKYQEAIAQLPKPCGSTPIMRRRITTLEMFLFTWENIKRPLRQYTEALRINPNITEPHYNLGIAYFMMGNRNSALKEYEILKTMNPGLANALYERIK